MVWPEEVQHNVSMNSFTCALPENLTFNVKEASRSEVPTTALHYFLAQSAWRNHSIEKKPPVGPKTLVLPSSLVLRPASDLEGRV